MYVRNSFVNKEKILLRRPIQQEIPYTDTALCPDLLEKLAIHLPLHFTATVNQSGSHTHLLQIIPECNVTLGIKTAAYIVQNDFLHRPQRP